MKKTFFKKIITTSLISLFFIQMLYLAVEPTVANAVVSDTATGVLVTLNVTAGITITNGSNINMAPHINLTQDKSVGTASWTVATNNTAGYDLTVLASATPALAQASGDSFADYVEASPAVPEAWIAPAVGAKAFGFSAFGTDVPAKYNAATAATNCGDTGTGVVNANSKYEGFTYPTAQNIATKSIITPSGGIVTTLCVAAQQNAVYAKSGAYTATITATATTK